MILSDIDIIKEVVHGNIKIEPDLSKSHNTNSCNVTLSDELLVYDHYLLDMKKDNPCHTVKIPKDGMILEPGNLYLGRTEEYTETHGFVPMLEGRSSIGRLGIMVRATAGFGDAGFCGYWTLEISCIQPVRIYAGIEIAQLYFHTLRTQPISSYDGKYQNNKDVQASKLWKEFRQ